VRLIDLIEKHSDESILMGMGLSYDLADDDRECYKGVLGILRGLEPCEGSMTLSVRLLFGEDGWYDVSGHDDTMNGDVPVDFDLEYMPWEDWLGMEIEEETAATMPEIEIIVHCLWNMTIVSFNPADLEFIDGVNEKGGVWSMPFDDFRDEFGSEYPEDDDDEDFDEDFDDLI